MPVGGHAPQHGGGAALGRVDVDAVQIIARLLGRDRESGLVDQPRQLGGAHAELDAQLLLADRRELVGGQARQVEHRPGSPDRHLAATFRLLDADLAALLQLADDVEQGVSGDGRGAAAGDLGGLVRDQRQIHVGGGEAQTISVGGELDVGQDRNGRPPLDDVLDMGQRPQQGRALDGKLHGQGRSVS